MTIELPPKAKKSYEDAVAILQDNLSQRRTLRSTDQVITHLKDAVNEWPKFFEAWRLLGEVYLGTEQPLLSYLALKRAYYIKGFDPGVSTLLGEASLVMGRPALGLKYLKEVIEHGEQPTLALNKLMALAYAEAEEWNEALHAFGESLAEDPSDGDMSRACADALQELGYHTEAANVLADYLDPFRDFVEHQPAIVETGWMMPYGAVLDRLSTGVRKKVGKREVVAHAEDYRAWYQLGNCFLDGEQWAAAVACYKRALRIHPDFYDALYNMGMALDELGRPEEALGMYEAAIDVDPETEDAYLSIAELLEDLRPDDLDEIALNYLMYYRQNPWDPEFENFEVGLLARFESTPDIAQMLLLARIYLNKEEYQKAEGIIKAVEKAGSGEAILQWIKGEVLYELGRFEEAEAAYRRGLNKNIQSLERENEDEGEGLEPKLIYGLARLLNETERSGEALQLLKESNEMLDPDGLALYADIMWKDKPQESVASWSAALEMDPDHLDSLLGLAEKKVEMKKYEEAIILLERALRIDPADSENVELLRKLYPEIDAGELADELDRLFMEEDLDLKDGEGLLPGDIDVEDLNDEEEDEEDPGEEDSDEEDEI